MEDLIVKKIKNSFLKKKPLSGLYEKKLLKIYNTRKDDINFENKNFFEEYIKKADLYTTLAKRKKIVSQGIIVIFLILFLFIISIYMVIKNDLLFLFIPPLLEVLTVLYLGIKLIFFFKERKLIFKKNLSS